MRARNLVLCSSLALVSWPAPATAKKAKPDSFAIERIDYSGEGCPPASVSRMYAQAAPNVDAAFAKRKCQLHLQLAVQKGWSYALTAVDFRGFAALDASVDASEESSYHMSGESPDTTAAFRWHGAFEDEFAVEDIGANAPPYWSRCGGGKNLMITTTIAVDAGAHRAGSGLLELDDVDGQLFHVGWRPCS
jgi:hypothetical protein